jgi:predicted branched-subunit amino acid permease
MNSVKTGFLSGIKDIAPLLLGVIPFGLIAGATIVSYGVAFDQTIGMGAFIFAGASQLAMAALLHESSPYLIILLTVFLMNLRFVIFGASLAPYFSDLPMRWKVASALLLVDPNYAIGITKFGLADVGHKGAYFVGAGLLLWTTWQITSIIGALLGSQLPENMAFALPLMFLALLMPNIKGASSAAAALGGGSIALLGIGLPFHLGTIIAIISGAAIGILVERSTKRS